MEDNANKDKSKRKNSNREVMQEDEELQQPTIPKKTKLSDAENDFLQLQQRYHQLLDIPTKQRSAEEKKEYTRLQPKYSRQKAKFAHLVKERPTASAVERKQKSRENMSEAKQESDKSADRKRKATPAALSLIHI